MTKFNTLISVIIIGVAVAFAPPMAVAHSKDKPHKHKHKKQRQVVDNINSRSGSTAVLYDMTSNKIIFGQNPTKVRPIASITKLMTAMVVIDVVDNFNDIVIISPADVDVIRHSSSKLQVGTTLTKRDLFVLSLSASENRAAHALARSSPGGVDAFVGLMNAKAKSLGMNQTHYVDPTGLGEGNTSTANDLIKLVTAVNQIELISASSTVAKGEVIDPITLKVIPFRNTNAFIRNGTMPINVSKTGFINPAGFCVVMVSQSKDHNVAMIVLGAPSSPSRIKDLWRLNSLIPPNKDSNGNQ